MDKFFDTPPNIIMITCHDLGKHLGCYGVSSVQTENIDRLAQRGCKFDNFFATAPTCSPSRASLHTGRYPQSNGVMGLIHSPWWWQFNEGEKHTAELLRNAGYSTHLIGFQHVTNDDPAKLGYDYVSSREKEKDAEHTVSETLKLIQNSQENQSPFFAKVGFFEVHRLFTRGENTSKGVEIPRYLQDTPAIRKDLTQLQAVIKYFDECVGKILDEIENSKLAENTLIIFTSDHGLPYIGAKWTLYDPGIEIPLIMFYPKEGLCNGKVYNQLMSNVDFLPTLLDLIGIDIPENMEGVSFKEVIEGKEKSPRTEIFAQHAPHALRDNLSRCIRTEKYKLIRYFQAGRSIVFPTDADPKRVAAHTERPLRGDTRPFAALYDLENDPAERNNFAQNPEYKNVADELSRKLWKWMEEVNDPILKGPLPTPYYLRAMKDFRNTL